MSDCIKHDFFYSEIVLYFHATAVLDAHKPFYDLQRVVLGDLAFAWGFVNSFFTLPHGVVAKTSATSVVTSVCILLPNDLSCGNQAYNVFGRLAMPLEFLN